MIYIFAILLVAITFVQESVCRKVQYLYKQEF